MGWNGFAVPPWEKGENYAVRRKIGDRPGEGEHNYITNELGVGYRLNE